MKFVCFIKKSISVILLISLTLTLSSCTKEDNIYTEETAVFIKKENGNFTSTSGIEYSLLANGGIIYYLGDLEFSGGILGEEKTSQHLVSTYRTGMFKIKDTDNDNILIRRAPNNEWFSVYRKTSLSDFDFSVDNCIRLEFVSGIGNIHDDIVHTTCQDGISDQDEIDKFLSEIRMQEDPREAGLYDMIKQPDGRLENCYVYGVVYGFFEEEPNLALKMQITSYNDLAYSISMRERDYVLPKEWLEKLQNS